MYEYFFLKNVDSDLVFQVNGEMGLGKPKIFSTLSAAKISRKRNWRLYGLRDGLVIVRAQMKAVEIVVEEEA